MCDWNVVLVFCSAVLSLLQCILCPSLTSDTCSNVHVNGSKYDDCPLVLSEYSMWCLIRS